MRLDAVIEFIEQAIAAENLSDLYQRNLAMRLSTLHNTITLTGQDPARDLRQFVFAYTRLAPRLISCIDKCARSSGTLSYLQTSLELSYRILAQASAAPDPSATMQNLLASAYQCHRLVEELYENNMSMRNSQVVDSAVTEANLLAHHLVGEELASGIDEATMAAFQQLVTMPDYYHLDFEDFLALLKQTEWAQLRDDWSGLLVRHNIAFNFGAI